MQKYRTLTEEKDNRIDKAIEYIEENMSYIANGKKDYIPSGEDLLSILKRGTENE